MFYVKLLTDHDHTEDAEMVSLNNRSSICEKIFIAIYVFDYCRLHD